MEQHFVIGHRREEDLIQREIGFVRLAVDELAADVETAAAQFYSLVS
jgi:hypothetical protein